MEKQNDAAMVQTSLAVPEKVKHKTTIYSSIPPTGFKEQATTHMQIFKTTLFMTAQLSINK